LHLEWHLELTEGAMAYRFAKSQDTVQDGVRKIATNLIDNAVDAAKQRRNPEETVHELRKTCKRLRGLIRLVRPVFADYHAENAAFRDAGRKLSYLRDTAVLIQTYDTLLNAYDDQVDRARFAPIRRRLTLQQKQSANHSEAGRRLEEFGQGMAGARGRVRRWRLSEDGFDAIEPGITKSYKAARRAMAAASQEISVETVHEWRKRVKDHWYHTRLLTPIWRKQMKTSGVVARDLGELLGQHHDLDVFQERLVEGEIADAADLEVLIGLAKRRQEALADEAFVMGARLLAEPPKNLTRRWRSYWQTWRSDEPREAALAA
jgi:CHAD domain-containing protein